MHSHVNVEMFVNDKLGMSKTLIIRVERILECRYGSMYDMKKSFKTNVIIIRINNKLEHVTNLKFEVTLLICN